MSESQQTYKIHFGTVRNVVVLNLVFFIGGKAAGSVKMTIDFHINTCIYIECPRRNVPDFVRVFLMLKYTDITQNTYVQS